MDKIKNWISNSNNIEAGFVKKGDTQYRGKIALVKMSVKMCRSTCAHVMLLGMSA